MVEAGGPSNQSGVSYQNTWAALFLADLCDPRGRGRQRTLAAVRVEAPSIVDDILLTYEDGHRDWLHAKERLDPSSREYGKVLQSFLAQLGVTDCRPDDRLVLKVGTHSGAHDNLGELARRTTGAASSEEWLGRCSKRLRATLARVRAHLPGVDDEAVWRFFKRLDVDILPLQPLIHLALASMPASSVGSDTLFAIFRDHVAQEARHRGEFRRASLLDYLRERHDVLIRSAARSSGLEAARRTFLAEVAAEASRRHTLGAWNRPGAQLEDVWVPPRWTAAAAEPAGRTLLDVLRAPGVAARAQVLAGEVGAGKTEVLIRTASQLARDALECPDAPLPLLVSARDLRDGLEPAACRHWPAVTKQLGALLDCTEIRWTLLVDSLDEAGRDAETALDVQRRFLGERLHSLVVATRPTPYPALENATALYLAPWTPLDVEQFLTRWEAHDRVAVEHVRESPHRGVMAQLLANPLTATLALLAAHDDHRCLASRSGIYREVVERLYQDWAKSRGASQLRWHDVSQPLQRLALETVRGTRATISRQELGQIVREHAPDRVVELIDAAHAQLGVLVPRDGGYDFAVRGLAEHLAGCALLAEGRDAIQAATLQRWGEEPVRHAIGLAPRDAAVDLLRRLLVGEAEDDPGRNDQHLRAVLAATRAAADLGELAAPLSAELGHACMRRLLDEQSTWLGERVASAAGELMASASQCAADLRRSVIDAALDPRDDPAAWYAAQTDVAPDSWARALYCRDSRVRRVAVERLGAWVDSQHVADVLALQLADEGWEVGELPPAIAAGVALRHAVRTPSVDSALGLAHSLVRTRAQLGACAAAIALRPDEAPPEFLVRALREGAQAFWFPRNVVEELHASAPGAEALARDWPEWRTAVTRLHTPGRVRPDGSGSTPPVSREVRARLIRALGPALHCMGDSDLRALVARDPPSAWDVACRLAYERPAPAVALFQDAPRQLPHLGTEPEDLLGIAALRHRALRDALLAMWGDLTSEASPGGVASSSRSNYPGRALEPLIRSGDPEAALAYAAWLPHAPSMHLGFYNFPPIPPEVLAVDCICSVARTIAGRVFEEATDGTLAPDGQRRWLHPPTAGSILRCLASAWREDGDFLNQLSAWLAHESSEHFRAAMISLEHVPLTHEMRTLLVSRIRGLIGRAVAEQDAALWHFHLPETLRLAGRMGLVPHMMDVLRGLLEPPAGLACHAAAVLLPRVDLAERAGIAAAAARRAFTGVALDFVDRDLLRDLVRSAPQAWADALEAGHESLLPSTAWLLSPSMGLSPDLRERLASLWARSAFELPWVADWVQHFVRPADSAREVLFDLGIEVPEEAE